MLIHVNSTDYPLTSLKCTQHAASSATTSTPLMHVAISHYLKVSIYVKNNACRQYSCRPYGQSLNRKYKILQQQKYRKRTVKFNKMFHTLVILIHAAIL